MMDTNNPNLPTGKDIYRQVVENSPNPIFSINRAGTILTWNRACETTFQYGQEMVGRDYNDILWDALGRQAVGRWVTAVFDQQQALSGLEICYRAKDGGRQVMRSRLYPIFGPAATVEACVFANTDVTPLKQSEAALQASEEKYRQVVENATEAIVVAQDGVIKFFNRKLLDFAGGYTPAEIYAMPFIEFVHPDDRQMIINRHQKRLKGEHPPQVYAFRVVDKKKTVKWVEINVIAITWENRPATLFFLNDITERVRAEQALKQSEARYRQLVRHAPAGIYEIDFRTNRFISVNDVMCEYSGYSREEFETLSPLDILTQDSIPLYLERQQRYLAGGDLPETAEFKIKNKNGQELWVLVNTKIDFEDGKPARATAVVHNITERKQAEAELEQHRHHLAELVRERTAELTAVNRQLQQEVAERKRAEVALRESHERLLAILDGIDADVYVADMDTYRILFMNQHMQNSFGRNLTGGICWQEFRKGSGPCAHCTNPKLLDAQGRPAGLQVWEGQNPVTRRWYANYDRAIRWVDNRFVRLQIAIDITERKHAEAQLQASLREKEVLLKEIHHRVKNNLQVISSLLSLQAGYVQDQKSLELLSDSQHRVRSMALIHEKLYRSENLAQIEFSSYIHELATFLFRSQNARGRGITLNIQAEPIFLAVDTAVPCGLIINELVSNALKHAFGKNHRRGEVRIEFQPTGNGRLRLVVADNGVGLPPGLDFRHTDSLGLQLVNTLVEQLEGVIELDATAGAQFTIHFKEPQDEPDEVDTQGTAVPGIVLKHGDDTNP